MNTILAVASLQAILISGIALGHAEQGSALRGDAVKGREVFNGKGICHYCHGTDGFSDRRPQLAPDTKAVIDRLSPPPANLRKPEQLQLKDDKARFQAIREGHPGSAMLPDKNLTDEEIKNLLAYLAALRKNAPLPGRNPY